jgi:hypothetical protein
MFHGMKINFIKPLLCGMLYCTFLYLHILLLRYTVCIKVDTEYQFCSWLFVAVNIFSPSVCFST